MQVHSEANICAAFSIECGIPRAEIDTVSAHLSGGVWGHLGQQGWFKQSLHSEKGIVSEQAPLSFSELRLI